MSTTLATTTTTPTTTRTDRLTATRQAPVHAAPRPTDRAADQIIGKRPASELTRLVFCVILGIAACIALVGVVDQATMTSPDDPPPPVIVDFD
jgi:hypothetical protein